jgi:rhamnose utilization protein RhaD (predicted bifunctional aldolase and dehydrogenase)/NAD(P)-dependent dehydrogenase (short-subunit alcohol dehydrogenase family)
MKSRWSQQEARRFVERCAEQGVAEDLALRLYSSRLLGAEPRLVQHGGGNTSLKTKAKDLLGCEIDVIHVKGSGWDLDSIEAPGMPALRLAPLLALRSVPDLSDEQMVAAQRSALIDPSAPTPSVETLLHAWVPARVIDHTHANAVLSLTDQPDGEALCRDVFGDRVVIVPYVMPGFALARVASEAVQAQARSDGMVLLKHGIFSWGESAEESYERMIELVTMAEGRIAKARTVAKPASRRRDNDALVLRIAPTLRGALMRAGGSRRPLVLDWRGDDHVLDYLSEAEFERYAQAGVATPDHVIRIKPWPLILGAEEAVEAKAADTAVAKFVQRYRDYFERWSAASDPPKRPLDPTPAVVLALGVGLFGVGANSKSARIAADIAETTMEVVRDAEALGRFESISERDLFEMEHWSLEQAKLGKQARKPLEGTVVAITGGGGAIGAATARAFALRGSEVAVLDIDLDAAREVARDVKGVAVGCDVTNAQEVEEAFAAIVRRFGGVDILVSNAGAAWTGRIGEVPEETLRDSFELNFFGHQRVARAAVKIMLEQGTGGCLLFNVSKQALNPGPDFGPYGAAKAATLFLARQYAVDYGADGIRSNIVNADRIRSGLLTPDMIADRAQAREVTEAEYMSGNLLGREVTADDVAEAFVALAMADKTTGCVLTVDGGNIAAAPR